MKKVEIREGRLFVAAIQSLIIFEPLAPQKN